MHNRARGAQLVAGHLADMIAAYSMRGLCGRAARTLVATHASPRLVKHATNMRHRSR